MTKEKAYFSMMQGNIITSTSFSIYVYFYGKVEGDYFKIIDNDGKWVNFMDGSFYPNIEWCLYKDWRPGLSVKITH